MTKRVDEVEGRVVALEKEQDESSSMIAYIKKNPRAALGWLVPMVVILSLTLALSEPLRAAVVACYTENVTTRILTVERFLPIFREKG